ncbi:RnfABCDGE type electron transport complex subunit D [Alkaliphilus oremlandii]|uniref:Ion-translocating oxidoreductase complex subunit D n=1 Tax=Alkaliphilus oremlandii (strain OhILAs) TaxID=350688 RepID=A8MHN2_ALKOO|nr:RnfABCDGE type electron transport complex subunit D [Alkaliphilus oremlandii]ABW19314.1 electron transport complex, RnfABCDGE type, D subunit [Alkaliphilus oremlandii OhILAs]
MEGKLIVSSSPHIRVENTIQKVMLDVIIALLPATVGALYYFRLNGAKIILLSVLTAIISEMIFQKIRKQPVTINDLSAVVTGLLLAFNIPASAPWWIPVLGSMIAIIVVKQFFGGVGHNFMNPALAARIMLMISYTGRMTSWVKPGVDARTTATPLSFVKGMTEIPSNAPKIMDMLFGNIGGSLGETSAILLILGGIYLVYRGIISIQIPAVYIGTVAVASLLYGQFNFEFMIYHLLAGGLMLGAIYMATDYASAPVTPKGRIIFALGCGILTSVIRFYGNYPEGVGFSILLMNIAAPLIEKYTSPRVFGEVK